IQCYLVRDGGDQVWPRVDHRAPVRGDRDVSAGAQFRVTGDEHQHINTGCIKTDRGHSGVGVGEGDNAGAADFAPLHSQRAARGQAVVRVRAVEGGPRGESNELVRSGGNGGRVVAWDYGDREIVTAAELRIVGRQPQDVGTRRIEIDLGVGRV